MIPVSLVRDLKRGDAKVSGCGPHIDLDIELDQTQACVLHYALSIVLCGNCGKGNLGALLGAVLANLWGTVMTSVNCMPPRRRGLLFFLIKIFFSLFYSFERQK